MSYPVAFWGFWLALVFIVGWTIAAGVPLPVTLLLWAFYLAVSLALTRMVAEAGLLFVQTGWITKVLITRFGGTDSYRKGIPFFLALYSK